MVKKPVDYTPQIQSTEERKRLLKAQEQEEQQREEALLNQQAQSYGHVLRLVFKRGMTIDALAGLLLDSRERLQANPQLEGEWTARGEQFFRPATTQRKQQTATNGPTGNGHAQHGNAPNGESGNGQSGNGQSQAGAPALQPPRPRPAAPSATPDLLGGLAPDQPGQSTPAEGGDDGGQQ